MGRITVRHKGSGHKRRYRQINFNETPLTGICCNIEYDPNWNAYLAALYDLSKKDFHYILAPKNLKVGDIVKLGSSKEPKLGHSLNLNNIPSESYVYNVSNNTKKLAKFSRAAGTFSKLKEKSLYFVVVKLPSTKYIVLEANCSASIGIVSNELDFLKQLAKAGQSRWLNKRPSVRGVAMNPVDHPHGGGEGKKSGRNKTPWGKYNRTRTNEYKKKDVKI